MEIVPLFFDKGKTLSTTDGTSFKNPRTNTSDVERTADFVVSSDSSFSWNLIGSDANGRTFGIVGVGGVTEIVGNGATATVSSGSLRSIDSEDETTDVAMEIGDFLENYEDVYLAVTNTNAQAISYRIDSSNGFSLPEVSISAAGKVGNVISNLEFKENRSRHFDALKYSLFNAE